MNLINPDALAAAQIWAEAEGEPFFCKLGVGEAIRNRMRFRYSSDGTVAGTVARRFQFSSFNDDVGDNARLIKSLELDDEDPVVRECIRAWRESVASGLVGTAVCYYAVTIPPPSWVPGMEFVAQFGKTRFYRVKGAA